MDLQGTERASEVSGPFRAPRYGRPDIQREPDAYMRWLVEHVAEPAGELRPLELPMIEDVYTIGPKAERKWFVVVTDPQKERSVCDDLRRDGIEPFAPLIRSAIIRKGKKRIVSRQLLPRYVFAGLPQPQPPFRVVLEAHGARELLGRSGSPVEVPACVVEDLRRRDAEGEFDETEPATKKGYGKEPTKRKWKWVKPGAWVRVVKGPFASFNGIVEEVDAGRKRAKVGMSIFGRVSPVELEFDQIEQV